MFRLRRNAYILAQFVATRHITYLAMLFWNPDASVRAVFILRRSCNIAIIAMCKSCGVLDALGGV